MSATSKRGGTRRKSRRCIRVPTEGAATYAGYKKLLADGRLDPTESTVLFQTGSGLKTHELAAGL